MTKKDICLNNPTVAYWSAIGGVEVKKIEYGVNDYIYCVSNAWGGRPSYHRIKIQYADVPYITLYGYKLKFDECIRNH